jgi:3-oxoacyl-[acyl-carrier-protein] synthase-1/3-oxoacyl-[acyl-carrier-protein] synthase II
MQDAVAPASAGHGALDGGVRVLEHAIAHDASVALKLAAAFGGANAALVLTRDPAVQPHPITTREVYLSRAVALVGDVSAALDPHALAGRTGYAEDRLARADGLVRLTIAAVAQLRDALAAAGQGELAGAGIVVGHGLATIDTNAAYLARITTAGASRGEPRRFPYTTPNAPAGECAVAFGLTGPAFAVGCGPHGGLEALATAADLVRAGVADRIVVVAVDEAGPGSRRVAPGTQAGAVALLVAATPLAARLESCTVSLSRDGTFGVPAAVEAHRALVPLAADRPDTLSLDLGGGGFAQARMFWL